MIIRSVGSQLEGVEGKLVAAVVVDGLERREEVQECGLTERHLRHCLSKDSTDGIKQEAFKGMVVQCTKCIGYVKSVVDGMEVPIEPLVYVHAAVEEVLPCINDEPRRKTIRMISRQRSCRRLTWLQGI
jgi:hypothetical protein